MNCRAHGRVVESTDTIATDIARIDQLLSTLRAKYQHNGPWLTGQFGIADCMFAPIAFRFQTYAVKLSNTTQEYMHTLETATPHTPFEKELQEVVVSYAEKKAKLTTKFFPKK